MDPSSVAAVKPSQGLSPAVPDKVEMEIHQEQRVGVEWEEHVRYKDECIQQRVCELNRCALYSFTLMASPFPPG